MSTEEAGVSAERPWTGVTARVGAPYMNPYVAGVLLGLVLLTVYVVMGRGLGASGAMSSVVALAVDQVAPDHAAANEFYTGYLENGYGHPLKSFLIFEVIGVLIGGFLSGLAGGRVRLGVAKGSRISALGRLSLAFVGGGLMGVGAKFARGCTSGQALSGAAVLNLGSWAFMLCVFVGAYAVAYFVRKEWT